MKDPSKKLQSFQSFLEKSIHSWLWGYLKDNGLIYKYQSGVRANFETDLCVEQLRDFISTGLDQGMYNDLILTSRKLSTH